MGRATLGAFSSTSLGIVTAESGLTSARPLLNHRQVSFARRLNARPRDGDGPEEILERDRSALAIRLRAAAALRRTAAVEPQVCGTGRIFPGRIVIESRDGTIIAASQQRRSDIFWTDGSRLSNKRVGAAIVWQLPSGWVGRRYHLGNNKEVFDAEVFAIYQALRIINRQQESGRRHTLFFDSTAAIEHVRTDALGPGQAYVTAEMKVCDLIIEHHHLLGPRPQQGGGKQGSRQILKGSGGSHGGMHGAEPDFLDEAFLSYMARAATETRSQSTAEWISSRIGTRRYRPPPGRGLRRQHLRNVRKELAGRFYQFLSGHPAVGSYFHDTVLGVDFDRCWRCNTGERQSRFHTAARLPAWAGQARVTRKRIARCVSGRRRRLRPCG